MTTSADPPPRVVEPLAAVLGADVAALDRELIEIDMLVGQAQTEAVRHEQKRVQAAEKLSVGRGPGRGRRRLGAAGHADPAMPC